MELGSGSDPPRKKGLSEGEKSGCVSLPRRCRAGSRGLIIRTSINQKLKDGIISGRMERVRLEHLEVLKGWRFLRVVALNTSRLCCLQMEVLILFNKAK